MSASNLIIINDQVTFETHLDSDGGIYFVIHNNTDTTSLEEYKELSLSIDRGQAHMLKLWLEEHLK